MPELMDLNESVYVPERGSEHPRASMKSLSRRPNRHMMDEARYTDRNIENTMKQPLRRRPIEFIKAQQPYDPSKDLIEKLRNLAKTDPLVGDMALLRVEEEMSSSHDIEDTEKKDLEENTEIENENLGKLEPERDLAELPKNLQGQKEVDSGTDIGDEGDAGEQMDVEEKEATPAEAEKNLHENQEGEEEDGDDDEEDEEGNEEDEEDGDDDEDEEEEGNDELVQDEDDMEADGDEDGLAFVIDNEGDSQLHDSRTKVATSKVIQQRREQQQARPDQTPETKLKPETVPELEHDPYFSVGKVMLRTTVNDDGTVETSLPSKRSIKGIQELEGSYFEEESEDTDEEAAFEDYMSQLMMTNSVDSDDDLQSSSNEDEDDINNKTDDEGAFSQYQSDDYDEDTPLNSDEEGLEEILSFARNHQKSFAELNMPPTQTMKKKGKGKNLRLDIDDEIEMELRQSLMEQFQYQRQSRRDKKLRKKEQKQKEALVDNDLYIKYDYMLHIKEIKQEFETFLHDPSREAMSFPPLDGHGNKTLSKLAKAYNMKCTRCGGNGLHMYMKVSKTRKTFHYLPDYNQINSTLRQRPVFKRADVKTRPKEVIDETDGKKGRRGPKNDAYVKEGDIVGGAAPEIGASNIGRQLLEKLGWVKGEGLGAHGNKGISEPLLATVKKSKTGLK